MHLIKTVLRLVYNDYYILFYTDRKMQAAINFFKILCYLRDYIQSNLQKKTTYIYVKIYVTIIKNVSILILLLQIF